MSLEIVHFHLLKIGEVFNVDGERFVKHDDLTYTDVYGMQHYIDPLFDAKIGKFSVKASTPIVDTSAKVVKDESEQ
jgi:hypothetical protein